MKITIELSSTEAAALDAYCDLVAAELPADLRDPRTIARATMARAIIAAGLEDRRMLADGELSARARAVVPLRRPDGVGR